MCFEVSLVLRVGGHEEEALAGRRLGTAKRESEGKGVLATVTGVAKRMVLIFQAEPGRSGEQEQG